MGLTLAREDLFQKRGGGILIRDLIAGLQHS